MLMYVAYLTLGWAVFALLYRSLLEKETFFHWNRFYLLFALLGGLILPALGMAWAKMATNEGAIGEGTVLPTLTNSVLQAQNTVALHLNWIQIGVTVWMLGALVGLVRMLYGVYSIVQIAQQATERSGNVRYSADIDMPFSFFNRVFIPELYRDEPALDSMMRHEQAHVRGWHSADVLLCELLCVLLWWHPMVYWFKRQLRTVHEYIADAAAVRHFSRQQYGLLLIRQAQSGPVLAYANHFLQSPLKQRLVMLSKQHSAPVRSLRYALIIPAMMLLLTVFQQNTVYAQAKNKKVVEQPEQMPEFLDGGTAGLMKFLADNITYPAEAKKAKIQGVVAISFVVNKSGGVESVKSLKPINKEIEAEAIRVVKLTRWKPAIDKGKTVNAQFTLPIKFKLD